MTHVDFHFSFSYWSSFSLFYNSADDAELTIGEVADLIQPRQQEWQLAPSEEETEGDDYDNDEDDEYDEEEADDDSFI